MLSSEEIIEILSEWNFWSRELDTGKHREQTDKIVDWLKGVNKIICVVGVRRSGKSYILRQVAKKLSEKYGANNVLYVNFEEARFPKLKLDFLIKVYRAYREIVKPNRKPFLLLDEIQEVSQWEKFARTIHEKNEAKIVVTGSSSKLLSEELVTKLAGRDITIEIFPLSFREYLEFKGLKVKSRLDALTRKNEIVKHLREYVEYGGFPEVTLEENTDKKKMILRRYYETILVKDVEKRFKIRSIEKLETLASYLITSFSSPITYRKLARTLEIPVKTVERHVKHLETSRMIFNIERFSYSIKERVKSPRKIYCIDNGIITATGFKATRNMGRLIENIVAIELLRRKSLNPTVEVYYWKDNTGKEVDFIVKQGLKVIEIIQVSYKIEDPDTRKREIRAILKAKEKLKCKNLKIITWEEEAIENQVEIKPLWKWLLNI